MKRLLIIILFIPFLLLNCGKKKIPTRQEIISRHSNGEKKIVVVYEGIGIDEKIIKRISYNRKGRLELLENNINRVIDYFFNGQLVKRKQKHLEKNLFALIREDTVKTKLYLNEWSNLSDNPDSIIARQILNGSPAVRIDGNFIKGIWSSNTGAHPLFDRNLELNKVLKNYSISFDGNVIREFGIGVMNNRRYVRHYRLLRLYPSKKRNSYKSGELTMEYVEVDENNNRVIGERYSNDLLIKDPFTVTIKGSLEKRVHAGIKKSDLLW
tara:strand:+ start:2526 stop:3329 length:804 start_codon:yes stop_codon:yes gene_type:complete